MSVDSGIAPRDGDERDMEAAEWCLRLAEGPLDAADRAAFDAWIEQAGNGEAFEQALLVWQGAEAAADMPELIRLRADALERFRRANGRRWASRFRMRWYAPVGAAAAVLVLAVAAFLLLRVPVQVYKTGVGERQVVMLEDGSRVSLDGASRVESRMDGDRRELRLVSGRAKFDVARDPLRPFSVSAGDKLVVATGTSFSVELVGRQVHVVLYEGHVEVLDRSGGTGAARSVRIGGVNAQPAATVLTPGRELVATLDQSAATVAPTDLVRSIAWEGGQLSFDNEPLTIAVERANRYSRTTLVVGDRGAASIRISGVFAAGDTEAFVEGVTALYGVRAERSGGQLRLNSR